MSNLALHIYRMAARIAAFALCRHEIVKGVYAGRGVGRGEISFGRSDIDLCIIVRNPDPDSCDGPLLSSLYRRVCGLRRINPALSHMMVHDPRGLDRWMRTDTYFGSQERRSMILLAGKPTPMPLLPVKRQDAVRFVAFWPDQFFPIAIQQHNRRNLHKTTLEIWKSWAVARGIADEPYLTLRETERKARACPDGAGLASTTQSPQRATEYVMKLAAALHEELLPPLRKLRETMIIRMLLPPKSRKRVLVVLPQPGASLPAEAFEAQSFIAIPELLHLYIHYLNPFLDWTLPSEIKRLGFTTPDPVQFVRACQYHGQDNTLRMPGFVGGRESWLPGACIAFTQHSLPYLQNGEVPPPMKEEDVRAVLGYQPAISEYYERDFSRLYRCSMEQLKILDQLAG